MTGGQNKKINWKTILIISIAILAFSCNNNADEKAEESITDSTVTVTNPPRGDEYRDLKGLPEDYIEIKFAGYKDTLYGYRTDDTLIVEGDMRFVYQHGTKRGVGKTNNLWSVAGDIIIIPYKIDSNYKYKDRIFAAFKYWTDSLAVRFVPYKGQTRFIHFIPSGTDETSSEVGQSDSGQYVKLSLLAKVGNIAHEIGHVLGLYHEQSRADRDSFVVIKCAGDIDYIYASNKRPDAKDFGFYDFFSIMHYSEDKCLTVLTVKKAGLPEGIPGQRNGLSHGDVATIRKMYHL